jgi:hypothetical protein
MVIAGLLTGGFSTRLYMAVIGAAARPVMKPGQEPARHPFSAHAADRREVQREGLVVHLVVDKLTDLSDRLAAISGDEAPFPLPQGRGDEFHHGGGSPDSRDRPKRQPSDIFIPDLHIDTLKLKPRNFR